MWRMMGIEGLLAGARDALGQQEGLQVGLRRVVVLPGGHDDVLAARNCDLPATAWSVISDRLLQAA